MCVNDVILRLFDDGIQDIAVEGNFIKGTALAGGRVVAVIGTCNRAAIDCSLALSVAGAILETVAADAGKDPRPIVFLVDTAGQVLSRHDELLGLNGYFAHVARCVDLARRKGHRIVTVVHGEAVSGGFLAFGLMADRVCSLPQAQVRVMDLRAMARVTKIPHEDLVELARESPVFAPGAENFYRMGAVHEMWSETDDWRGRLAAALAAAEDGDGRAGLGLKRGGRKLASPIATLVEAA
jgi:malonate decarboxylase gamma subunit